MGSKNLKKGIAIAVPIYPITSDKYHDMYYEKMGLVFLKYNSPALPNSLEIENH